MEKFLKKLFIGIFVLVLLGVGVVLYNYWQIIIYQLGIGGQKKIEYAILSKKYYDGNDAFKPTITKTFASKDTMSLYMQLNNLSMSDEICIVRRAPDNSVDSLFSTGARYGRFRSYSSYHMTPPSIGFDPGDYTLDVFLNDKHQHTITATVLREKTSIGQITIGYNNSFDGINPEDLAMYKEPKIIDKNKDISFVVPLINVEKGKEVKCRLIVGGFEAANFDFKARGGNNWHQFGLKAPHNLGIHTLNISVIDDGKMISSKKIFTVK